MKCDFRMKGLDCANCAAELERAIQKVRGVDKVTISFMSEKMTVELDEDKKDSIIKDIEKVVRKEEPDVTMKEI